MSAPDYYDSQESAAANLKIELETLREAKRCGCPAFRSGRVYRQLLLEWLAKRKKEDGPSMNEVRRQIELERLQKLRNANAVRCGSLLEEPELAIALADVFASINAAFQRLPHVLARQIVGLRDVAEINDIIQDEIDAAIGRLVADPFQLENAQASLGMVPMRGIARGAWRKMVDFILREAFLFFGRRFLATLPKRIRAVEVTASTPADVEDVSGPPPSARRKRAPLRPAPTPADIEAAIL